MRIVQCAVAVLLALPTVGFAADTVFVKWEKSGSKYTVAAIDLTTRNVLWEVVPCKEPNFAKKTAIGVLVGCEDSNVMMLDAESGKEIWRRDLAGPSEVRRKKNLEINRYHGETANGFFVSVSDETYLLIGKKGEYLMRCDMRCDPAPRAEREELMKNKKD